MAPAVRFELRHAKGVTALFAGEEALAAAGEDLARRLSGRALYVVSAPPILALHGEALERLRSAARSLRVLEIPDGEPAKCVAEASRLWSVLAAAGAKRDSVIAAFGGGTVGDLAGFVAATFLRGVELMQLPTTLLAQVDAAVGGKTAIDLPEAKNSVGAFHHPSLVVADAVWLSTLPDQELRSGLVETIKTAALLDAELLDRIERGLDRLRAGEPGALGPVAAAAARAKARLVESDPEEAGPRQLLNLGHTLGHALETAAGYGRLRHGDAVAHGLRFALALAAPRGLDPGFGRRLAALLDRLGVPPLPPRDGAQLLELVGRDKKAREGGLTWVLPIAAGRAERVGGIAADEIAARLAELLAEHSRPAPL
jgi:3-dehydroquinate synthase